MVCVSIIIPVYNVEKYIKRCLDSLINQTLKDIEIICIDDLSPDNSLHILKEYAAKDSRIKVIALDKNCGAAIARNKGLDAATGEFLGFIDPDDNIDLNYYEALYNKAKETGADVVKCSRRTYETDGRITYSNLNETIKKKGILYFGFEWTTAIYKSSIIFENKIRFPEELIKAQDTAFLNKVLLKTSKPIEFVENVYYNYYRRTSSLNSNIIPIKYVKSALLSQKIQLEDLNASDLFEKDSATYMDLFLNRIYTILAITAFQNPEFEAKSLCAQGIIDCYNICKDKKAFERNFVYKKLMKYIKNNNSGKIAKLLSKISRSQDLLEKDYSILQKIFSIKNEYRGNIKTHKIISIVGIKIKIKCSKYKCKEYTNKNFPIELTDKEKIFLIDNTKNCKSYLEYGSGGSTFLILLKTQIANITSVESDKNWIKYLRNWKIIKNSEKEQRLNFILVNIGKTRDWGRPIEVEKKRHLFPNYSKAPFFNKNKFDLIFIDGRFRVACALQAILNCSMDTKIIMHDFTIRPEYKCILEFLEIVESVDTMVLFKIKENYDKEKILNLYEKYKFLFE